MKKILVLVAVLLGTIPASAQHLYFTTEELPDLIQCLPAPPDSLSAGFGHDVMRYFWGKEQRQDSLRAEITKRDAVWSFEAVIGEFSVPCGLEGGDSCHLADAGEQPFHDGPDAPGSEGVFPPETPLRSIS